MKKLTLSLIAAALIAALASCGGSTKSESSDSDTTVVAEATVEESPQLLQTPDLALLEVKGNVKEIKGKTSGDYVYGKSARFDQEGNLTHFGNSVPIDKISNIERDSEGKLTDFLASEWMSVKWEGEKPLSMKLSYNEFSSTESYKYDNNGHIVEISSLNVDEIEETENTIVGTVTYPEDGFDANGNWVKRFVKYPDHTETQEREIIYY